MSSTSHTATRQIARAAGTVMAAMVLSQVFGLVANIFTARSFGTSLESDAFFAANRFSEVLFNLVAGGALASAFVPTFSGLLTRDDRAGAWRLASAVANVITLVLVALAVLAAIFAPQVVQYLLAPGWSGGTSPEKEALVVELLRIQLPSAVLFGLSGLVMGILNANHAFLFSALAPAMYKIGWIFGLEVLAPRIGVDGLAWGVVLGAALHLSFQLPALYRLPGRRYLPTLGLDYPPLREVIKLMGPRLISVAVTQLNFLVNTNLASILMPDGGVTGLSLAFPLMIMPQAAIAQSIGIAALPTFSAQAAQGRLDDLRASLAATLRGILLLSIPASLGLILLRVPLVQLIYEHGEFNARSTELVAWALLWFAAGLVGHSVLEVVTRAFFALKDTKTPTIITTAAMGLNLVFSLLFSAWFSAIGWMPHGGLALANSLATFLEVITLLALLRRKTGGLGGPRVWAALGQGGLAAAGMGLALGGWLWLTAAQAAWLQALGGVALGGAVYALLLVLQRVDEVGWALGLLRRRLLR